MAWTRFFQAIVLVSSVCPMCILAGVARSQSSDSKDLAPKPTRAGFEFDVNVLIPTTIKPRRINKKRICCQVGRSAARKGYTCYLRRNIEYCADQTQHAPEICNENDDQQQMGIFFCKKDGILCQDTQAHSKIQPLLRQGSVSHGPS
eukprot:Seg5097.1 transcript_id=Seg5097.1/GoldUCD/mRNA.D3Y31 product="hypothetical protein" protein_id=Seg5097.1/GoldUCD/D3Y31